MTPAQHPVLQGAINTQAFQRMEEVAKSLGISILLHRSGNSLQIGSKGIRSDQMT